MEGKDHAELRQIPVLSAALASQLRRIKGSKDRDMKYVPCLVHLRSGEVHPRVYVADAERYILHWGVWPWEDDYKAYVPLEDVVAIEESPNRLPARLASKMYMAGESGMGYSVFTLALRDGRRFSYTCGNAVDFVDLPNGVSWDDVEDLFPHEGPRDGIERSCSDYAWCLYRRPRSWFNFWSTRRQT